MAAVNAERYLPKKKAPGLDRAGWPLPVGTPPTLGNWRPVKTAVNNISNDAIFDAAHLIFRAPKAYLANTPIGQCLVVERLWVLQRCRDGWYADDVADPYDDTTAMRSATRHGR
ncbi:MAG TPA: hypothetical protein VLE97_01785 [Gaiellaceae bacterium]|nr:hypothetical protein [Gaiellaceae bacterium]